MTLQFASDFIPQDWGSFHMIEMRLNYIWATWQETTDCRIRGLSWSLICLTTETPTKRKCCLGSNFLRHRFWSWKVLSVNMCQVSFIRPPNKHKQTIPSNFFGALMLLTTQTYSNYSAPPSETPPNVRKSVLWAMNSSKRTCGKTAWSSRTKHEKLREKSIGNNKFHLKSEGEKKHKQQPINT